MTYWACVDLERSLSLVFLYVCMAAIRVLHGSRASWNHSACGLEGIALTLLAHHWLPLYCSALTFHCSCHFLY